MVHFSKFVALVLIIHNVALCETEVRDKTSPYLRSVDEEVSNGFRRIFNRKGCENNGVGCGSTDIR
jgi:hypothetical protein